MRKVTRQDGFSLVSVLVALAVAGLLAMAVITFFKQKLDVQRAAEIQSDLVDIRRYVTQNLSCVDTLVPRPSACDDSARFLSVLNYNGETVIPRWTSASSGGQVGSYALRARCVDCPTCPGERRLTIEVMRVGKSSSEPALDPLTKEKSDWKDLFRGVPIGCPVPDS